MRRDDPQVLGQRAQRLLDDPAFEEVINAIDERTVTALKKLSLKLDGSPETEQLALEMVRQLGMAERVVQQLKAQITAGHIAEDNEDRVKVA